MLTELISQQQQITLQLRTVSSMETQTQLQV